MGCCASGRQGKQRSKSLQEVAICWQEDRLGFGEQSVKKVMESLARNSSAGKMNVNQFHSFAQDLSLDIHDIDTIESKQFSFYQHFKSQKSGYDACKLALLAILLCSGSLSEKATALFEHCPGVSAGTVADTGVKELLTILFDIAIDLLPILAEGETPVAGQVLEKSDLETYRSHLREVRTQVWRRVYIALILTNKTLTLQDFLSRFQQSRDAQQVTSASDLRELLAQEPEQSKRPL